MNTDLQSKLEQEVCFLQISIPATQRQPKSLGDDSLPHS